LNYDVVDISLIFDRKTTRYVGRVKTPVNHVMLLDPILQHYTAI